MALKRLIQDTNYGVFLKKSKTENLVILHDLKNLMENNSPTTGIFAFGIKHFQDLALLKSMLDIFMKPLPSHEFVN
jgi:hypothetical protein